MIAFPRPAVPYDGCPWCGASLVRKGLAPPPRDCCPEQIARQRQLDKLNEAIVAMASDLIEESFDYHREMLNLARLVSKPKGT